MGVDGVNAEDYERDLEGNLQRLLDRAKSGTYQAPPVRRVHIPKDGSSTETRPLGIPTLEDKNLQRAVVMLLEPIYEHDFLESSYGFRPGRSRRGDWVVKQQTASDPFSRAVRSIDSWCRDLRHWSLKAQQNLDQVRLVLTLADFSGHCFVDSPVALQWAGGIEWTHVGGSGQAEFALSARQLKT